jgi:hypothetical protein
MLRQGMGFETITWFFYPHSTTDNPTRLRLKLQVTTGEDKFYVHCGSSVLIIHQFSNTERKGRQKNGGSMM